MAIIESDFNGRVGPGVWGSWFADDTFTSYADLSAAGHYTTTTFQATKSGIITDVGFYLLNYKQTGSAYYELSLKALDSGGAYTTTNYGGSSGTVLSTSEMGTGWTWYPLSTPATVTAWDVVAPRLQRISSGGGGSVRVPLDTFGLRANSSSLVFAGSSYAGGTPAIAFRYDDDVAVGVPVSDVYKYLVDLNDTPDEVGALFTLPIRMRCTGVVFSNPPDGNCPFFINLYESDDTILTFKYVYDEDIYWKYTGPYGLDRVVEIFFDPVWLEIDTPYRLAVRSSSTSIRFESNGYVFVSGSYTYCVPYGEYMQLTYRSNSGSWTDVPGSVPYIALIMDKVSYDTSSGASGTSTTSSSQGFYGWAT